MVTTLIIDGANYILEYVISHEMVIVPLMKWKICTFPCYILIAIDIRPTKVYWKIQGNIVP